MAEKRTSHAYAQLLLELATGSWVRGLRLASRRLHDSQIAARLEDPAVGADEKTRLLAPILSDVTQPAASFVRSLVTEGDLNKLDTIVEEFESLVVRRSQYMLAHVRSAVALTSAESKQLEKNLARRFGKDLEFEYEEDPSLIGGVIVRVGDEVIDGSLAGKLSALRERLV